MRKKCAVIYDFDGTLARGNIQEHTFLPDQGIDKSQFWDEVKEEAKRTNSDEILVYMLHMLQVAKQAGHPVTRKALENHGAEVPLFPGVSTWFDRINTHAATLELNLDHYIISSGNYEMIRGCPIFDKFRYVFASSFIYSDDGEAEWPGVAINYTTKTQYLFRINKGVINHWNNKAVNTWVPMEKRDVPFERMIFIGDGDTDIPCMKMVRLQGGHSVAVFDEKEFSPQGTGPEKLYKLISEDRVHFVAPANYEEGRQLDITIKGILGKISDA